MLPTAAVPALAATAAAVCLAPQAMADPAPAHAAAKPAVVADAVSYAGLFTAKQHAAGSAARSAHAQAQAVTYTVREGDSLASIADRFYHQQSAWPVLYWANRNTIRWANMISAGQVLKVPAKPAKIPAAPGALGPVAPAPALAEAAQVTATSAAAAPAAAAPAPAAASSTYTGGTPGGAFGQCVVARESGGNPQIMNSSGHYGLYQFSESTWVAYGGSAADFGHASVAEQNQVFGNALAQGGQSNWSPYDGC